MLLLFYCHSLNAQWYDDFASGSLETGGDTSQFNINNEHQSFNCLPLGSRYYIQADWTGHSGKLAMYQNCNFPRPKQQTKDLSDAGHNAGVGASPDILSKSERMVIRIDGDYFHLDLDN